MGMADAGQGRPIYVAPRPYWCGIPIAWMR
jgi:hypothetical protein